jgi:2-succinyl-6-hydroxy-2,4-cyclohexadiene-1-carboxylate synthase
MRLPEERWGSGPTPALFLHGFTGSREAWRHLEPLLGDVLSATCVDLPGHRDAPLPEARGPGAWDEVVDALAGCVSGPSVIIGYSQGARLALAFAVRHPQLVERLVLESGTPGLHRRHDRALRRAADEERAEKIRAKGVEAFVAEWECNPLFASSAALPEAERLALRSRRLGHTAEGLAGALTCMGQGAQPDYWPALTRILRPTLLVTGALDEKYTHLARRMVEDLKLGWRVTLPGVGHAPHLECPRAWAAEVRSFLQPAWSSEPVVLAP